MYVIPSIRALKIAYTAHTINIKIILNAIKIIKRWHLRRIQETWFCFLLGLSLQKIYASGIAATYPIK